MEGKWVRKWTWRRQSQRRERGERENITRRLEEVQPDRGREYKVEWLLDESRNFNVKKLRDEIDNGGNNTIESVE